ncbi:NAD(P)-binding protein [Dothidotthia symphoricarpi CBS 119687]|uniref:NAD(P)-binding protein n=1 Tax=Dothidotthia symphoricarpi CBS 119687 TaxID=1392245 RepID=A0A6A6AH06_9PLEO|nr:NAD(P)-binding protein [Dothidotthia symphoricarpi CBS 119687]KAF2130385.1 NAD(P)-binding protein [Dothidotthia symphoricarpi CBS 119687]
MPLTILADSDVRALLHSLTKQDILDLQQSLADALHHYSTATVDDSNGCCAEYQPLRTTLKRNDGQTTLFMPASSEDGMGIKVVTLSEPGSKKTSKSTSVTSSIESLSISQQSSETAISSTAASTTPKGSITLLDKTGSPRALINAEELTAFRTALASTFILGRRDNVHDVVVFGAGKQAYWHIRLALLLRGSDIHHLNIINRDFERVHHLLEKLYSPNEQPSQWSANYAHVPAYRQENKDTDLHRPKIQILTPGHGEYDRLLKSTIRASSVIFCTTPSLTPLFPAALLTNAEGRKKGRYIAAIGSYKPHMIEIHPDIIRQNVAPDHGRHFHKHATQGGAIIVDSVEACMQEAGEIIQAGLSPSEVVEVGELVMLKRDADRRRQTRKSEEDAHCAGVALGEGEKTKENRRGGKAKDDHDEEDKAHKSLIDWLTRGNVIYKSVGLGLMDVVVGTELCRLADERGIGTQIKDF